MIISLVEVQGRSSAIPQTLKDRYRTLFARNKNPLCCTKLTSQINALAAQFVLTPDPEARHHLLNVAAQFVTGFIGVV